MAHKLRLLLGPMRVPFLVLAPACVAVGAGTAFWQSHHIDWFQILLVLGGAVACHVCVNVFNEYFDFTSGLDAKTERTPFSGGSGMLQAHPEMGGSTLVLAVCAMGVAASIGLYFVWVRGWQLLPLGIAGICLLVTYTIWLARDPFLCLLAPGLGFGVLTVKGTHFALTGTYSGAAYVASLVPTFLVSDLLLLNQFPDVEADRSIGRRHFPITIGRHSSAILYGILLLMAYLAIVTGAALGLLPPFSLIALVTIFVAWKAYRGAYANAENVPGLVPSMALNFVVNLAAPLLLAAGLFIG